MRITGVFNLFVSIALSFCILVSVEVFDVLPGYLISTSIILGCGALIAMRRRFSSFQTVSYVIIFLPALTPFYAFTVHGASVFSLAAMPLQSDAALMAKTALIFAMAAITYTGAVFSGKKGWPQSETIARTTICFRDSLATLVIGALVLISAYVLEPGPTLISANYVEILAGRFDSSTGKILVTSLFGAFWVSLFLFARQRRMVFYTVTIVAALWLLLHARRVELMGIGLVMMLYWRARIRASHLYFAMAAFLAFNVGIGVVRNVGVLEYLSGQEISALKTADTYNKVDLPGGASNVFLSGMHLVNARDAGLATGLDLMTFREIPKSLVPNFVWNAVGLPDAQTEHEMVFEALNLQYVGGMPLVSAFYLNGGLLMVLIFGLLHGLLSNKVEKILQQRVNIHSFGGDFTTYLMLVLVFYQFRYHWYLPHTLLRALEVSVGFFILLRLVATWRKRTGMKATAVTGRASQNAPDCV